MGLCSKRLFSPEARSGLGVLEVEMPTHWVIGGPSGGFEPTGVGRRLVPALMPGGPSYSMVIVLLARTFSKRVMCPLGHVTSTESALEDPLRPKCDTSSD